MLVFALCGFGLLVLALDMVYGARVHSLCVQLDEIQGVQNAS